MSNHDRGYIVHDRRGKEEITEVCRVCGSPEVHSKVYNQPTMDCVKYLRAELAKATERP
jgi:formate dehydrogenase maturation protein FdhE